MALFGPTVLRLAVGVVFAAHGAQKLFGLWGGGRLTGTAAFFEQLGEQLGLTPAYSLAILAGTVELSGGQLVAGAFTLVMSAALTVTMLVAVWTVHLSSGFFLNWTVAPGQGHGYEFNLAPVGALISLMLTGPGAAPVVRYRTRAAETKAFGRARKRAGQV